MLHRLSVRVAGQQYEYNPHPHKPLDTALAEALAALKAKVTELHGDGYELSLMPAMTVDESTRAGNGGFPISTT